MPDPEEQAFVLHVFSHFRGRGTLAFQTWKRSIEAGHGGDLLIRVPTGERIVPEVGFKSEGFPT
jgi:hypothetical protein